MAKFSLPTQSQVKEGRVHAAPAGARKVKSFKIYRWDPDTAARLIDRERLTTVVAPAAMTGDLVRVAPSDSAQKQPAAPVK